ncbi:hypothetical protein FGG65_gp36 [Corynebacterium phage phi673]|uniref:Uncharacterized protein n=1 Tax=Corynebacterium phage phi673 TaxID=2052821 RepID=A0A2H4PIU7_9CAUD|nr:hypothetical protein FGG65_gp36 [Corynebacterium phage phi673]ATW62898.1 hypothetical protein phi673_gp36 [Corynebacterium phage phi673]
MFSEITTTRDIAIAVWNMGVLESITSGAQGTYIALIAEDGRAIEITQEADLIMWTTYIDNQARVDGDIDEQGAIELANAQKFLTSWAK